MKPNTERIFRAFFQVYNEFTNIYINELQGYSDNESLTELFQIAWNDSLLGAYLKEELLEKLQELQEAQQARAEEAMA